MSRVCYCDQQDRSPRARRPRGDGAVHRLGATQPARRPARSSCSRSAPADARGSRRLAVGCAGSPPMSVRRCSAIGGPAGCGTVGADHRAGGFEVRSPARPAPLDRLGLRRRRVFRARSRTSLADATVEAGDLLERGYRARSEAVVNEPLEQYARSEEPRLRRDCAGMPGGLEGEASPRELSAELEAWVDARSAPSSSGSCPASRPRSASR